MNRVLASALTTAFIGLSAIGTAEASVIHPMDNPDPTGSIVNSPGADWGRGYRFQVNADDLVAVELGLLTPSIGATYEIVLWDFATETALASVSAVAQSDWSYVSIADTPLTLGQQYLITIYGDATENYYFSSNPAPQFLPTGAIEYINMTYCNFCSSTEFPTQVLSGMQYGYVDFGYRIGQSVDVAEPGTLALLGAGLIAFGRLRRRKA